jgi:hypothetical protein
MITNTNPAEGMRDLSPQRSRIAELCNRNNNGIAIKDSDLRR